MRSAVPATGGACAERPHAPDETIASATSSRIGAQYSRGPSEVDWRHRGTAMPATRLSRRLAVIFCAFAAATPLGQRAGGDAQAGHTISGKVVDPYLLRPEGAVLMLGQPDGLSSFSSVPIPIAIDGSFTTPRRSPGVYVLELVRTP